jgi:hypothetical protein
VAYTLDREYCGRGGEADLVVHDDVHGAAGPVPAQLRQVQRLGDHALAGERGVAVDEHRQHGEAGSPLSMTSCLARTTPSSTGSTASRWLGLATSEVLISRPSGA